MLSTDFSFRNLVFWNLFGIFSNRNHLKNQYLPHSESKFLSNKIPLNPAHQDLSINTKGTFQFLRNFQLRFSLIFSKEIIQYSRTFASQVHTSPNIMEPSPCTPSLSKAFQRHKEHDLNYPGLMNLITTKQNKLPSFIDRCSVQFDDGRQLLLSQPKKKTAVT